jgi:hypothetical protein
MVVIYIPEILLVAAYSLPKSNRIGIGKPIFMKELVKIFIFDRK